MAYDCVIVDLVNLFYRQHFGRKEVRHTVNGYSMALQGVEGTIEYCQRLHNTHGGTLHLVVDNYTSGLARRQQIDPGYKAGRLAQHSSFYALLDKTQELLQYSDATTRITRVPGYEADDLVPHVIRYEGEGDTLLVSSDLDWARPITSRVHWYNFDRIYTPFIFEKKYGFRPGTNNVVRYKAYTGDVNDGIPPGCPRLPRKVVLELIEYGPVATVLKDVDILDVSAIQRRNLRSNTRRILLNEALVDFQPFEGDIGEYVRKGTENYLAIYNICTHLGLNAERLFPELAARNPGIGAEYSLLDE